jgi:hypothetical protein
MKSSSVNREVLGFEGFLRGFREVSEGVSGFSGVSGSFRGFPGFSTTLIAFLQTKWLHQFDSNAIPMGEFLKLRHKRLQACMKLTY